MTDRLLVQLDGRQIASVIRDLRLARQIVSMLDAASPAMQKLVRPRAVAAERAIADVVWRIATRTVGRPDDRAIQFALLEIGNTILVFESEALAAASSTTIVDEILLNLVPEGDA